MHTAVFPWAQGAPRCSPGLDGATPTPLSHSSMASPSPAVLLKLLVLEEEREMLARPFSFSLTKGLQGTGRQAGPGHTPRRPPQALPETEGKAGPADLSLPPSSPRLWCWLLCSREFPRQEKLVVSQPGVEHIFWGPGWLKPTPPHPRPLTSPCWGRSLENWGWMRSQTLSPEKSVRPLGSWGCWTHCH